MDPISACLNALRAATEHVASPFLKSSYGKLTRYDSMSEEVDNLISALRRVDLSRERASDHTKQFVCDLYTNVFNKINREERNAKHRIRTLTTLGRKPKYLDALLERRSIAENLYIHLLRSRKL
jgi:hypothetical protein